MACFSSHSRLWQTSGNNIWGSTRYSDIYCGSYSGNSVTPKKLMKTQLFEKKSKYSSGEKILAIFSTHSGVWQTSVNTLYGSTKYFDKYCGRYRINSVTPKKLLKTQTFEKKANFPVKKSFCPVLFPHSRVWQTSGANLWISTIYFDDCFWSYGNNSVTPKKLLKTQFFEKKANVPVKKSVCCIFSRFIECGRPQ